MSYYPNTELVAVGLLKNIPELGGGVATELPADNSSWSASGFVQVLTVGGSPSPYLPVASPVVGVDCWAVNPNSGKPPWGKAAGVAEYVRRYLESVTVPVRVVLPAGFEPADVLGAWVVSEPRRIREDTAGYAHFSMDVRIDWVRV